MRVDALTGTAGMRWQVALTGGHAGRTGKGSRRNPLLAEASRPARLDGKPLSREGGSAESFNCVTVQLGRDGRGGSESRVSITPEKTRHACRFQSAGKLDAAIKAALLPHTTGFFLGASAGTEYADDLACIRDARRQPP
jgi:hypothetical protein